MLTTLPIVGSAAGYIAYTLPAGSLLRYLAVAASASILSVGPFTGLFIQPVNKKLQALVDKKDEISAQAEGPALLKKWKERNDARMLLFLTSWASTITLVLLQM